MALLAQRRRGLSRLRRSSKMSFDSTQLLISHASVPLALIWTAFLTASRKLEFEISLLCAETLREEKPHSWLLRMDIPTQINWSLIFAPGKKPEKLDRSELPSLDIPRNISKRQTS